MKREIAEREGERAKGERRFFAMNKKKKTATGRGVGRIRGRDLLSSTQFSSMDGEVGKSWKVLSCHREVRRKENKESNRGREERREGNGLR